MTFCGSSFHPGGASPRWRSESQIADGRLQIWNLTFGICHPEGHAFVAEGLRLDRHCTTNNPGQGGRRKPADALIGKASLNRPFQK
jgi:hypothetical protein